MRPWLNRALALFFGFVWVIGMLLAGSGNFLGVALASLAALITVFVAMGLE